jgi:transposase
MLTLPPTVKIYIDTNPINIGWSFDRLAGRVRDVLVNDPLSGHLFVFFNRQRDRVKILFWDRSGFCLFYKRLELGTFRIPAYEAGATSIALDASELAMILEGIDLATAKRTKRFVLHPAVAAASARTESEIV